MKTFVVVDDGFLSKLSKHFGKNKNFWDVTQIVRILSPEVDKFKGNNYINVSVNNLVVGDAAVTRMVRELPHKQYLLSPERSLGSNPSRSASTSFFKKEDLENEG
jgi:hypothetical protein